MKKIRIVVLFFLVLVLIGENYLQKKRTIDVINNREEELVFSLSIEDFINSYNKLYMADKNANFLPSVSKWDSSLYDAAIHSKHKTIYYNFTRNKKIWGFPKISVYTSSNNDYIQEITLDFDSHSSQEALYNSYQEMCFYTIKVFFPELSDEKIRNLFTVLDDLAYENMFPNEQGYRNGSVPYVLYYRNGIGIYPYFAVGEYVHLCIIPVTQETLNDFDKKGVEIYEIE